jgi:hypothetical protein
MLNEDYAIINEWKKFICRKTQLDNSLAYIFYKKSKIEISPIMIMIWTFEIITHFLLFKSSLKILLKSF